MFKGFGNGNCWYYGRDASVVGDNKHIFRCNDMGEIAANTEMSVSFQFVVRNLDKGMAAAGTVTSAVTALTCALEVYTIDAVPAALPGTSWFS